jgi:hypothetical protein
MSGKILLAIVEKDGPTREELAAAGVTDDSLIRVNRQGDIEIRRRDRWDIVGGLLGDFDGRIRKATGLDWA